MENKERVHFLNGFLNIVLGFITLMFILGIFNILVYQNNGFITLILKMIVIISFLGGLSCFKIKCQY